VLEKGKPLVARTRSLNPTTTLVISSLVLLASGGWLATKVGFAVRSHPVRGQVTRTYPCRLGRRSGSCGDIAYVTDTGFHGSLTGIQGVGAQGTQVELLVDPANAGEAQLSGPVKFWLGPVGLTLASLVFVALSGRQLALRRRGGG
jgi:hypothetical protein